MAQRELKIIANLQDNVSGQLEGIQGNLQNMRPQFQKMQRIGAASFAAISGAVFESTRRLGNHADALLDASTQTGLTTRQLQEYQHVADMAGVETDVVANSAQRFTRRLSQVADQSGDAYEAMQKLGVQTHDNQGSLRGQGELLDETIKSLANMEDQSERNVMLMELFGRSGLELAPILEGNSGDIEELTQQAHDLGLVMEEDALISANEYRQSLQELRSQAVAIGRMFAETFIPVMTDIAESLSPILASLRDWVEENPQLTKTIVIATGALFGIVAILGTLGLVIPKIIAGVKILTGVFTAIASPIIIKIALLAALVAGLWWLWDNSERVLEFLQIAWEGFVYLFQTLMWNIRETITTVFTAIRDFFIRFWSNMRDIFSASVNWIIENTIGRLINGFERVINIARRAADAVSRVGGGAASRARGAASSVRSRIPGLAEGGIVTSPTLAMIGEGGESEAVIPLSKLNGTGGGTTVNITVRGDVSGRDLVDKVKKAIAKETNREIRL